MKLLVRLMAQLPSSARKPWFRISSWGWGRTGAVFVHQLGRGPLLFELVAGELLPDRVLEGVGHPGADGEDRREAQLADDVDNLIAAIDHARSI